LDWQDALLWCPDPHTLVVIANLQESKVPDPKTVPLQPRNGARKLPSPLRTLFTERPMGSGNVLWLAGNLDNEDALSRWHELISQLLKGFNDVQGLEIVANLPGFVANFVAEENQDALARIRTFEVGVRLDEKLSLAAQFRNPDPKGAGRVERFFKSVSDFPGVKDLPGFQVKVDRSPKDNWVVLQIKANLLQFLGKNRPGEKP
jgi:hypothetical protein